MEALTAKLFQHGSIRNGWVQVLGMISSNETQRRGGLFLPYRMPHARSFELQMVAGSMLGYEIPTAPSSIWTHTQSGTLCHKSAYMQSTNRMRCTAFFTLCTVWLLYDHKFMLEHHSHRCWDEVMSIGGPATARRSVTGSLDRSGRAGTYLHTKTSTPRKGHARSSTHRRWHADITCQLSCDTRRRQSSKLLRKSPEGAASSCSGASRF